MRNKFFQCYWVLDTGGAIEDLHIEALWRSSEVSGHEAAVWDVIYGDHVEIEGTVSVHEVAQTHAAKDWQSTGSGERVCPTWIRLIHRRGNYGRPPQTEFEVPLILDQSFFTKIFCKSVCVWELSDYFTFILINIFLTFVHNICHNSFRVSFWVVYLLQ